MEKKSPAHKRKEIPHKMDDALLIILGFGLAGITALDFILHSNQGLSDPETRKLLTHHLGSIIKNIGNFGYAAAITIPIVFTKKILAHTDVIKEEETIFDHVLDLSYKLALAGVMASIVASEDFFPPSREFVGDSLMSMAGILMAKAAAEETLHRFSLGRHSTIRGKADALFPSDIPTRLDDLGFLCDISSTLP